MRKLFLAELLLLMLLLSCSSTENDERWLEDAYGLPPEEALVIYTQAVSEDPSPELRFNLAYTYLLLGDWDNAIATADSALDESPELLRFEYLKAYALRESGRMYSYERQLETILQKDPGNNDIRILLAKRYAGQGRDERAIELAKDVLRREPTDKDAISILALYYDFYSDIAGDTNEEPRQKEPWDPARPALFDIQTLLTGEDRLDAGLMTYAEKNFKTAPQGTEKETIEYQEEETEIPDDDATEL